MAKVLVIDDAQGIRSLLDTLLSRKGYDVVLADGGFNDGSCQAWLHFRERISKSRHLSIGRPFVQQP